ncbi:MAG: single-stranded DNA-binding protein [Bacteroidales bacterium]|nr:single-stranded DNA-binding protein [Bacteroidales bacterium]
METCINKIILRGRVGIEPRTNNVGENRVIRFSMATSEVFKGKDGQYKEEVTWHSVTAWSGKGMPDFSLVKKGSVVYVEGRLRSHKYVAADGTERFYMEVIANQLTIEEKTLPLSS